MTRPWQKRSRVKAAFSAWGASLAMVWAKHQPEAGVALKPPTKARPDPETAAAADWCDYVFYRDNPRGRHVEYWHHGQGCRLWLKVARDTVTHKIESAELVGPWAAQAPRKERGAA